MQRVAIAFWLVFLFFVSPAFADVDQHCLALCVNGGQGSPACLARCSYNLAPKPKPVRTQFLAPSAENHRILAVPLPVAGGDALLLKASVPKIAAPKQDRACLGACRQAGMQDGLCQERCTEPGCAPGRVQCLKPAGIPLASQFDFARRDR